MAVEYEKSIDGSFGHGGGQLLRNAITLSIMEGINVKIFNIRSHSLKPGLRPQHLAALKGAEKISKGELISEGIGSKEIYFTPGKVFGGEYEIDIGTAGSITLLLQCLLPPLLSARKETSLKLIGGTDVQWSPSVDYADNVLLPVLRRMGVKIDLKTKKRGSYPKGGGIVYANIKPSRLKPLEMNKFEKETIAVKGIVYYSNLPRHIPERIKTSAEETISDSMRSKIEIDIKIMECANIGAGTGITLWIENSNGESLGIGSCFPGKKGLSSEKAGKKAANSLIMEIKSNSNVDIHLGDQLPIFAPLIKAQERHVRLKYKVSKISNHIRTVLWLLEQFGYRTTTIYDRGFHIII